MDTDGRESERARGRPFKVGLALDATGLVSTDGATPSWTDILAVAQRAESLGFDSLWLPDHLLLRQGAMSDEGNSVMGAWECWSLLAALAAATRRVELGTIVLSTSFRNPALLAKMADTVDEISGGRLILGLGAGWHEPEYRAFGYPFDHRVARFEEALTIIHGLLREGRINFAGTYYEARDCVLLPRGPRPDGPPIMVGTRGPRMMALAAKHADLWNAWIGGIRNHPDVIAPFRATLDEACRAIGRDPATLARTVSVRVAAGDTWAPGPEPIHGTPEEIAAAVGAFASEGIAHVQLLPDPFTVAGVEALAPVLEILDHARPGG
jgi:probable F420-dependent oxidoreductase